MCGGFCIMEKNRFTELLNLYWDEMFMSSAEISNKLRLPVETIHKWCTGEELPDDPWYIDQIGKLLQFSLPYTF